MIEHKNDENEWRNVTTVIVEKCTTIKLLHMVP